MKRHLETCRKATELALAALRASGDVQAEIGPLLEELSHVSEALHAAMAAGPGWPAPPPEQTAELKHATVRLAVHLRQAARMFAILQEQAGELKDALTDP